MEARSCEVDSRPEPLSGMHKGTFAFVTIRDRLPEILTKVIDVLSRLASEHHRLHQAEKAEDAKVIVGKLSKLKNEMQTDKELRPVQDTYHDAHVWNTYIQNTRVLAAEKKHPSWYSVPWLTCECYLYRRIFESLQESVYHKDFDPFFEQKSEAFFSSAHAMQTLAQYVIQLAKSTSVEDDTPSDHVERLRIDFEMFLEYCLWGNKCDLSLSAGVQVTHQLKESSQLKHLLEHILCNDTEQVWEHILVAQARTNGHARVDFVLDNSGFELFTDLCLAEFLLDKKLFDVAVFHVKNIPWFVSDASKNDVLWTVAECAKSTDEVLRELGQRWSSRLVQNTFVIQEQPYWTYPHDFAIMKQVDPNLYEALSKSQLVIFKGDLNYRKLIGDRSWSHVTTFAEALHGFCPAPICALRTLKADLVVGLKGGKSQEMDKKDEKWMVNGQYAVIQYCERL